MKKITFRLGGKVFQINTKAIDALEACAEVQKYCIENELNFNEVYNVDMISVAE